MILTVNLAKKTSDNVHPNTKTNGELHGEWALGNHRERLVLDLDLAVLAQAP
jgi:hypothetical protein